MRGWPTSYKTRADRRREGQTAPANEEKESPNGPVTVCDILREQEESLFELEKPSQLRFLLRPFLGRMSKRQRHDLCQLLQPHYGAAFLRAAGLLAEGAVLSLVTSDGAE